MIQSEFLAKTRLRVVDGVRRTAPEARTVVVRAPAGARRLVLTAAEADLLFEGFGEFTSVAGALARALAAQRCPPLRKYYELILQAHAAGVLVDEQDQARPGSGVRWRVRLPPELGRNLGAATAVAAAAACALAPSWRPPSGLKDWIGGWVAACAFLSAGQMLAACAIAGAGCEVRSPRIAWKTIFPHFRIDTDEAVMGGRMCERAVAWLRSALPAAGAAAVAWRLPGWLAPCLASVLLVLAPFGGSAGVQWMTALRGDPQYSVREGLLFEPVRRDPWIRMGSAWRKAVSRMGFIRVAWTVLWAALVGAAFYRFFPAAARAALAWLGMPGTSRPGLEAIIHAAAAALAIGLIWVGWAAFAHWRSVRRWSRRPGGSGAPDPGRRALEGGAREVLGGVPLFKHLSPEELDAVAAAMKTVVIEKGQYVVREDEPGDAFYVAKEGEFEVLKRLPGSRRRHQTIGWMGPGDAFGEIALLESVPRTATIRAARRSVLLELGREGFERLVVGTIGAKRVRELLQHARFLGRFTFMAGLSFDDLVEFSGSCGTVRCEEGVAVLRKGDPNLWFYLIFDGAFAAREGERVIRRMGPGDYFGEISLLEGSAATADVVALEESRCLKLFRDDFLKLFARDFRIGLPMESVAASRAGYGRR